MKKLTVGILASVFVVIAIGAGFGLGSSNKPAAVVPTTTSSSTSSTTSIPNSKPISTSTTTTWTTRPVTQAPGYCDVYATWNKAIDEWNKLTVERDKAGATDVVVNGVSYPTYEDWAKANGKPVQMVEDNCGQQ